jgi:hypothetical protein
MDKKIVGLTEAEIEEFLQLPIVKALIQAAVEEALARVGKREFVAEYGKEKDDVKKEN